jgi:hypothetical protein
MENARWNVEGAKAGVVPDGPQKGHGNRHGALGPVGSALSTWTHKASSTMG